jgi:hypothetical protein
LGGVVDVTNVLLSMKDGVDGVDNAGGEEGGFKN